MVWKGNRALRSSFASRNEGILVLKNKNASDSDGNKSEEVFYSLGKQNRWMIPEMVKESNDLKTAGVENGDFVLIERRNGRPDNDEVSLYSSGNVWRGLGKKSRIAHQANDVEMILEVTYPNGKANQKFVTKPMKRSKHNSKQRKLHMKIDEGSCWDDYLFDEDDLDTNDYDSDNESQSLSNHTVYLEDYISLQSLTDFKASEENSCEQLNDTSQIDNKDKDQTTEIVQVSALTTSERCTYVDNKIIVIDDDDQLAEKHKKTYDLLKERNLMLKSIVTDVHKCNQDLDCHESFCFDMRRKRKKRVKCKRKKLSKIEKDIEENVHKETDLKLNMSGSPLETLPEYSSCEVKLVCKDLEISELSQVWGKCYHEGQSYPRKFTISLAHPANSLESACILFQINCDNQPKNCNASIKLLLNNEMLKISQETAQMTVKDFCVAMKRCVVTTVEAVVDKAKICMDKHIKAVKRKKEFLNSKRSSLETIERAQGWKGEEHTEVKALEKIKDEIDDASKETEDQLLCSVKISSVRECGICFEELVKTDHSDYTMLRACGHSFCKSCYAMYIHTKLTDGQVDLECPQHSCKCVIDAVTIMSLVPSWYSKYWSWKLQRHLVTSTSWKNCPSEQCNRVIKVTPTSNDCASPVPSLLPVSCACNSIWCFSCQEQAHWPASCQETKTFRAKNTGYKRGKKSSCVTSVLVKNCPNCNYPIEKYEGCPHMYCIMCYSSFCWNCLSVLSRFYGCGCLSSKKKDVKPRRIELALIMNDAERFADFAVQSYRAVKAGLTVKKQQRIKSLDQGLQAHLSLKEISKKFCTSNMGLILDNMIKNNVKDVLQKAYTFQLQAHIAVEGMAISIVSESKKTYFDQFTMLLYILEKLADIISNPPALHKAANIERMTKLIGLGEMVLMSVKY